MIKSAATQSDARSEMKFLRVSLVHSENPDILSKRFTGLQDFQN